MGGHWTLRDIVVGHLTRRCGLTIDNLLAVDVVLADGRFVTANAKSHADLFWAVRAAVATSVWSRLFCLRRI